MGVRNRSTPRAWTAFSLISFGPLAGISGTTPAWRSRVRGWKRPAQQHDVAEFCSFLDSRDMFRHRCFQGRWQARSAEGGFRVADSGSTWPLLLAELPTEDCSVQMLIDDWHGQACIHALSEAPAFLLIQLNPFGGDDGGCSHCRVQHRDTLSVPTFRIRCTGRRNPASAIPACVDHHTQRGA